MERLANHPWELGLLLAVVLSAAIELGRRVADFFGIREDEDRREQIAAIRDGLFILVSLPCYWDSPWPWPCRATSSARRYRSTRSMPSEQPICALRRYQHDIATMPKSCCGSMLPSDSNLKYPLWIRAS